MLFATWTLVAVCACQEQATLERQLGIGSYSPGVPAALDLDDRSSYPLMAFRGGHDIYWQGEYWFELRYDPGSGSYRQVFTGWSAPVLAVGLGDVMDGPAPEVVLLLTTGRVEVRQVDTGEVLSAFDTPSTLYGLEVANSDPDPYDEIHVMSILATRAYDADGRQAWSSSQLSEPGVIVAQLDSDPGAEAAAPSGIIYDIATGMVQFTLPVPCESLAAYDVDADGMQELLCVSHQSYLYPLEIWDVDSGTMQTRFRDGSWRSGRWARCAAAGDLNHDGVPEVLCGFYRGRATDSDLMIWDLTTGATLLEAGLYEHGVVAMKVGDLDDDRPIELLVAGDNLSIIEPLHDPNAEEWSAGQPDAFVGGPVLADLDGNGEQEVVIAEEHYGDNGVRISVHSGDFGFLSERDSITGFFDGIAHDMRAADLDGDGSDEILVAGQLTGWFENSGFAKVLEYDAASRSLHRLWSAGLQGNDPAPLSSIEAVDLNRDGRMEILVGEHEPMRRRAQIVVYEFPHGLPRWSLPPIGPAWDGSISALRSADFDRNGYPEVIALVENFGIYVFEFGSRMASQVRLGPFTALELAEDEQGKYILIGSGDGSLIAFRWIPGLGLEPAGQTSRLLGPVQAVAPGPDRSAWAISGGRLHLVNLSADRVDWAGEAYPWSWRSGNGLRLATRASSPQSCLMGSTYALLAYRAR